MQQKAKDADKINMENEHQQRLENTLLKSSLVDCFVFAGLGWAGLGWAELGWAGLGWAGLLCIGLGWAGLLCIGLGLVVLCYLNEFYHACNIIQCINVMHI